jgi:hypothetical protein
MPSATAGRPAKKPKPKVKPRRRAAPPKLYTTEQVAAFTNREPVTVKLRSLRFAAEGEQFGVKIGRQWLYTEDEIRDLAAIPSRRGRAEQSVIEARRQMLADVPLDKLAEAARSLSVEPEDYSEEDGDPAS